nr:hypothetical protein CFP56_21596 [Quercus suber]
MVDVQVVNGFAGVVGVTVVLGLESAQIVDVQVAEDWGSGAGVTGLVEANEAKTASARTDEAIILLGSVFGYRISWNDRRLTAKRQAFEGIAVRRCVSVGFMLDCRSQARSHGRSMARLDWIRMTEQAAKHRGRRLV